MSAVCIYITELVIELIDELTILSNEYIYYFSAMIGNYQNSNFIKEDTKMPKIKDDEFYVKKNDIDAMRRRPTMYIGGLGDAGVFHLCKEIIDNNNDECIKPESPGNKITVIMDDKTLITQDNGRGIPTNMLRVIMETNQAGSNMTRAGGMTKGENGSGFTTYTAMSSFLEVISLRPTEKKKLTVRYKEGELVDEILEDYNGKESGLITTFKPSRKVLGTDKIPIDMLQKWLSEFNYTLPRGIDMSYTIKGKTTNVIHKELYQFFADPHHDVIIPEDDRLCNDFSFTCSGNLVEEILGKSYDRTFKMEVVITYADPEKYKGDDIIHSWMNMIHTSENGEHVNGVIKGFSKYVTEKVVQKNKKLEGVNLKRDIEAHMSIVVRGECNCGNMFSAQAKQAVSSKPLGKAIEEATYKTLSEMNSSAINEVVDVVIGNHRARIEGEKARNVASSAKGLKTWQKPDSYYPCSSAKTEEPKELFLVEGNSAGGGLKSARNAKFQAILTFRGKSLNIWGLTLDRALQSVPWLNLVKVLGCGIGPTFDIKKLNFDKIIIATDADIDGYHIRVGFCAFFVKFLPGIIEAGKLYIAEPPLYKLAKDKDVFYVASQTEYLKACIDSIGGMTLEFPEMK